MNDMTPPNGMPAFHSTSAKGTFATEQTNVMTPTITPMADPRTTHPTVPFGTSVNSCAHHDFGTNAARSDADDEPDDEVVPQHLPLADGVAEGVFPPGNGEEFVRPRRVLLLVDERLLAGLRTEVLRSAFGFHAERPVVARVDFHAADRVADRAALFVARPDVVAGGLEPRVGDDVLRNRGEQQNHQDTAENVRGDELPAQQNPHHESDFDDEVRAGELEPGERGFRRRALLEQ